MVYSVLLLRNRLTLNIRRPMSLDRETCPAEEVFGAPNKSGTSLYHAGQINAAAVLTPELLGPRHCLSRGPGAHWRNGVSVARPTVPTGADQPAVHSHNAPAKPQSSATFPIGSFGIGITGQDPVRDPLERWPFTDGHDWNLHAEALLYRQR